VSGPTELVRVTGLLMLQRRKNGQFLVMCLLFANVGKTEIWSKFCNVLIVCKCCRVIVRLLWLWSLLCFMNFMMLFVIKYFVVIKIPTFLG
jgi:hypothetical protein